MPGASVALSVTRHTTPDMHRLFALGLIVSLLPATHLTSQGADSGKTPPKTQHPADPRVFGRVVDERGKAIEGAAIAIVRSTEIRRRHDTARFLRETKTRSDKDGRYSISTRGVGEMAYLMIAARRRQAGVRRIPNGSERFGASMGDIVLVPGGRLVGRVRDRRGQAITGAQIFVESSIESHRSHLAYPIAGGISNEHGRFVVPCVPRRGARVTALAPGYMSASRLVVDHSPTFELTKTGLVRGRVLDSKNKPMAGVRVYTQTVESLARQRDALSDANGEFVITVPKPGRFALGASEQKPPHRPFRRALLRGPADDIVLRPVAASNVGTRKIGIKVRSREGQQPIRRFWLSTHSRRLQAQLLLLHHSLRRELHEESADLVLGAGPDPIRTLVVEAPGFGFEIVDIPKGRSEVLVELGPEALLTGQVVDAKTGRPRAGVAVRALPVGTASGSGNAEELGPLTDEKGRYTITGLRPGTYTVQTHLLGRPPSRPVRVELGSKQATTLNLRVPKALWIEIALEGEVPAEPRFTLGIGSAQRSVEQPPGTFTHSIGRIGTHRLTGPGDYRLGPVGASSYEIVLQRPSRTRFGTGPKISLGFVEATKGLKTIALPDLRSALVHGRIVLPREVPAERVAITATRESGGRRRHPGTLHMPNIAGISSDGDFTFDLPSGRYLIQAIDVQTGIVFHSEGAKYDTRSEQALTLRPKIRWLEIECRAKKPGAPVVLRTFEVTIDRLERNIPSMLGAWRRRNLKESGGVPFLLGATKQRWLIPHQKIKISARRSFGMLRPIARDSKTTYIGERTIAVDDNSPRIVFEIPAPPSDAELLKTRN